jgi:protein TonB
MRFTRLQLAFCVSLLVHSGIAGVVYVVQHNCTQARPLPVGDSPQVMELNIVEAENLVPSSAGTQQPLHLVTVRAPMPKSAEKPAEKTTPQIPHPVQTPEYARDELIPEDGEAADLIEPQTQTQENTPTATAKEGGGNTSSASGASASPVRYFVNAKPIYPEKARKRGQEGRVVLRVVVNCQGLPDKVSVSESSRYDLLDQAAMQAVEHWRFIPARCGDTPISCQIEVPIRFKLSDQ